MESTLGRIDDRPDAMSQRLSNRDFQNIDDRPIPLRVTQARGHSRRISDIALEAGFSDLSHFNRLFRSRFGLTPSEVRAQKS